MHGIQMGFDDERDWSDKSKDATIARLEDEKRKLLDYILANRAWIRRERGAPNETQLKRNMVAAWGLIGYLIFERQQEDKSGGKR